MTRRITMADRRARALQLKPMRRQLNPNSQIVIEPARSEMAVVEFQRYALLRGINA